MSTSTVAGGAATPTPAPTVAAAKIQAVVPVSVSTVAKQNIVHRIDTFLSRIEGDIAHDEEALVAFLKSHL